MGLIPEATVILASGSPRRRELLASLGIRFTIRPPQVDETVSPGLTPGETVEQLAWKKGRAIVEQLLTGQPHVTGTEKGRDTELPQEKKGPVLVIASDTVVVLDNQILGKPADEEDARHMLRRLSGRRHQVYSGLALFEVGKEYRERLGHARTDVQFCRLSDETIRRYVATGEPLDKAGSYAIQGLGATLVEGIHGDYFNVVGLPLALFGKFLEDWGYRLF
mgnify:FL=1